MKSSLIIFLALSAIVFAEDKVMKSSDVIQVEVLQSYTLNFTYIHQAKHWALELWLPPLEKRIRYGLGPSFQAFEKGCLDLLIYGENQSEQIVKPFLLGLKCRLILDEEFIKSYSEWVFLFPKQKIACRQSSSKAYVLLKLTKNNFFGFECFATQYDFGGIYEDYFGPKIQRQFNKDFLIDFSLPFYSIKSKEFASLNYKTIFLKFGFEAKF
jgi:hypothetical protein